MTTVPTGTKYKVTHVLKVHSRSANWTKAKRYTSV